MALIIDERRDDVKIYSFVILKNVSRKGAKHAKENHRWNQINPDKKFFAVFCTTSVKSSVAFSLLTKIEIDLGGEVTRKLIIPNYYIYGTAELLCFKLFYF
jgi:hypothetical protein